MRKPVFKILITLLTLHVFCSPVIAATIILAKTGSCSFTVSGEEMNGVAGIQMTLGYDGSSFGSPTVTQGSLVSGALLSSNTTIPGSILIAIVKLSPLFGSGQIVHISFGTSDCTAGISSITARLIDTNGATLPVQTSILMNSPSAPVTIITSSSTQSTSPMVSSTKVSTTTSSIAGTTVLGTVAMLGDSQQKNEQKRPDPPVNPPQPEQITRPEETTYHQMESSENNIVSPEKSIEIVHIRYESVLERFKLYRGERSPTAMMALFEKSVAADIIQVPAISISDGSTSIRLCVKLPKEVVALPTINLAGVELLSLKRDDTGTLVIDLLPKKNVIETEVSFFTEQTIITLRLTTVPFAKVASGKEAEFTAFLKDNGARNPKFDLNGDGVHDYQDDYIYTGNYLIRKKAATPS